MSAWTPKILKAKGTDAIAARKAKAVALEDAIEVPDKMVAEKNEQHMELMAQDSAAKKLEKSNVVTTMTDMLVKYINKVTKALEEQDANYKTQEIKIPSKQLTELAFDENSLSTELAVVQEYYAKIEAVMLDGVQGLIGRPACVGQGRVIGVTGCLDLVGIYGKQLQELGAPVTAESPMVKKTMMERGLFGLFRTPLLHTTSPLVISESEFKEFHCAFSI